MSQAKKRQNLPFTALRAFEAAGRTRGVRAASDELSLTPGAISQQIRQLEARLGVQLFDRANNHFELTPAGASLLARLTRSFDDLDEAFAQSMSLAEPKKLKLKLSPTFSVKWFAPRMAGFFSHNPGVKLEITAVDNDIESFDQCDFLVKFGVPNPEEFNCIFLFSDELLPVCSPELAQDIRTPLDLARHTLLESSMRADGWAQWLDAAGLDSNIGSRARFPNSVLSCEAAASGSGVAIMQWAYVQSDLEQGRLIAPFALRAKSDRSFYMASLKHRGDARKMRDFSDWVLKIR